MKRGSGRRGASGGQAVCPEQAKRVEGGKERQTVGSVLVFQPFLNRRMILEMCPEGQAPPLGATVGVRAQILRFYYAISENLSSDPKKSMRIQKSVILLGDF